MKTYAQRLTARLRLHVEGLAVAKGRPVEYLESSRVSKEECAREIAEREGIEEGLICVLSSVEPCRSYSVGPVSKSSSARNKHLELRYGSSNCLHQYLYFSDRKFSFGHLRLQTRFPFTIHVCVNGPE